MAKSHTVLSGSSRSAVPGATAIGPTNPNMVMDITVKLRRKAALPELDHRPAQPMTRKALASGYGASDEDIAKAVGAFAKFGLKATATDSATRSVHLTGSVADMEDAFQVKLLNYQKAGETWRGRVGPVQIPAALDDIVVGVFGLDNRRMVRHRRPPRRGDMRQMMGQPPSWYVGSELADHYQFPPGDGAGQTVALLEFGGGYFPDDLKTYCKLAKVAVPSVVPVSVDGTSTAAKDGAEGEVMLDVEVVAGICPKAKIAVYFAHWTQQGWLKILDRALHDATNNPGVVSTSWGLPEGVAIWTTNAMTQINETLKEAAYLGITMCFAAGDDGSGCGEPDGHAHALFPASSPYALAVGGTTIPVKGGSGPDICWKEGTGVRATGGGSTGGANSAVFPRPVWQKAITVAPLNPGEAKGRAIPDIAANADWTASPYLLVVDGSSGPNGGTSAATPLLAALLTRINAKRAKRVGYITPVLYGGGAKTIGAQCCTDVVSGDNITAPVGGYRAGKGYDATTGWGTPVGVKLAAKL